MSDTTQREEDKKVYEIIPWARSNPLRDIMEERENEKKETLKIAKRFSSPLFSYEHSSKEKINRE